MAESLLPPFSSPLERAVEQLINRVTNKPLVISQLWAPWQCPVELLPWLAWANSVDNWDNTWSEQTKRQVIDNAFEVHRYKATPHAIALALSSLDVAVTESEWWQHNGTKGVNQLNAMISDAGISLDTVRAIQTAVDSAKRGVIHYNIRTVATSHGDIVASATTMSATIPTVAYYTLDHLDSDGASYLSATTLHANTITVENALQ